MKKTREKNFHSAYAFFHACAGYSYVAGETPEQGRDRCARALADAEERGTALELVDEWDADPDADDSFMDQDGWSDLDRRSAEFYACCVRDASGVVRASMGGIHEDVRDPVGARYYRRVVRAELFAEALAEIDSADGRKADVARMVDHARRVVDAGCADGDAFAVCELVLKVHGNGGST